MANRKKHPLGWTDTELAFMVAANTDKKSGKVMNLSSIYRNMGYSLAPGQPVPIGFKQRVEALMKGDRG
jgi:hypothetical protein